MIQKLRENLRNIPLVYKTYMLIKRPVNSAFIRIMKRPLSSDLLGMTSWTEQRHLEKYGESFYTGEGEVVDLGSWLGSTTIPLIQGLLRNPAFAGSGRKVYAYDLFIWFDWMNPSVAGTEMEGKYAEGDNFVDEFKKRIEPYANSIEVRAGDLNSIGWSGEKIEFLIVDAMKSLDLATSILKDFYPHLVEGHSQVFHQDFSHYFTPWIHMIHWRLRDRFEFVEEVPASSSVVFKCREKISRDDCEQDFSFSSFTDEEVDSAFDYSLSLVSDEKRTNIAAAKVMWYFHQNDTEKAQSIFDDLVANGTAIEKDMIIVEKFLKGSLKLDDVRPAEDIGSG